MKTRAHIFILLLISFFATLHAAVGDIKFRVIDGDDGLSDNQVNAILKDSNGFMWFGTATGLNRWDGYNMQVFDADHTNEQSLHDSYVQRLEEDANGKIWVYAGDRYSLFDPASEEFHQLTDADLQRFGLAQHPSIVKIAGADFFVADRTGVFNIWSEKSGLRKVKGLPASLELTDIKPFSGGGMVAAVDNHGTLYLVNAKDAKVTRTVAMPGIAPSAKMECGVFVDNALVAWVYSVNGVRAYDITKGSWLPDAALPVGKNKVVKAVSQDMLGRIWVGYDNDGLEIIDPHGRNIFLKSDVFDPSSLGNNSVRAIYCDNDKGMWIGTLKRGVSFYNRSEFKFDVAALGDVNCIAVRDTATVWLGGDNGSISIYNPTSGFVTPVEAPSQDGRAPIACMASSADGTLWVGTYTGGLKRYRNGVMTRFTVADGLAFNDVWALLPNADGTLWVGTLGNGLQLFNPSGGGSRLFTQAASGLASDYILSLARTPKGEILIGTSTGISILNPATMKVADYTKTIKRGVALFNLNIIQVYVDSRGLVWIATREGLNVVDPSAARCYRVDLASHGAYVFVLGVIEDPNHSMWVSSGNRLYNIVVSRNSANGSLAFKTSQFGSKDGLSTGTFNQRSFCRIPSGEILAGAVNGVVNIDPMQINYNMRPPVVKFTSLLLNNKLVKVGERYDGRVILPKALDAVGHLVLSHDQNDITVVFSTDNYVLSDQTRFQYMLEGMQGDWLECQPGMHQASFTNLAPGNYTLLVRAVNSDNIPSESPSRLLITVKTPIWAAPWAIALYIVVVASLLYAAFVYSRRRLREKLHAKRKEEEAKRKEEVNQLKFKFFTNVSHELRTPLSLILAPVSSMMKEERSESDRKRLTTVHANASNLLYLVNQLLDFRKNEMSDLHLHLSSGDICLIVKGIVERFRDEATRRGITLEFKATPESLPCAFDTDKISKTVINLLSNAFKYTPAGGTITVTVAHEGNNVEINVADTGKGVKDADKPHLFERFYRAADASPSIADTSTGTGIGLSLVSEYVKLHGGLVKVVDNKPRGSVFMVTIPYKDIKQPPRADIAELHAEMKGSAPETVEKPAAAGGKPSLLVVDDNPDLREFLASELEGEYEVVAVCDGAEALEKLKQRRFDLILSDIMMPGIDGIELCRAVKSSSEWKDIPFLLLTAKQDSDTIVEGLSLGADDYVTKPFDNDVLKLRLRRLARLGAKGLKRSLIEPAPSDIKITSVDEQLVAKAVKYVEDNLDSPQLSVEGLSAQMGMSRVHLYKKLLALTGKPPIEFIRVIRLKRAAQYLRESQLNVSEIAYKVGFNNPKVFTKYFKEEFGLTPSDYQEREGS